MGLTASELLKRLREGTHVWAKRLKQLIRQARGKFRLILWALTNPELVGCEQIDSLLLILDLIRTE